VIKTVGLDEEIIRKYIPDQEKADTNILLQGKIMSLLLITQKYKVFY